MTFCPTGPEINLSYWQLTSPQGGDEMHGLDAQRRLGKA